MQREKAESFGVSNCELTERISCSAPQIGLNSLILVINYNAGGKNLSCSDGMTNIHDSFFVVVAMRMEALWLQALSRGDLLKNILPWDSEINEKEE